MTSKMLLSLVPRGKPIFPKRTTTEGGRNMSKVVTIAAMKGGTGKTMLAINLAAVLSESERVLIIDCDPQANASTGLGVDIAEGGASFADVLAPHPIPPEDVVLAAPIEDLPNLDLIPSSIFLTKTEMDLVSRSGRESLLAYYLGDHERFFAQYGHIIIDTNPSMGIVNQNAFFAADSIIIVTDVSNNGLQGIELFEFLWHERREGLRKPDNVRAIVVNNVDKRIKLASELVECLKDDEDKAPLLAEPTIPQRVAFKQTEVEAKPINVLATASEENEVIHALARNLMEKGAL